MATNDLSPMESEKRLRQTLSTLLKTQRLAVLSTHKNGQPYANLVAFACSSDLHFLYFATARSTRKFSNLQEDCRMALLISSSANRETDIHEAVAVTIVGRARELSGPKKATALKLYLATHPYLEDFARSPTCALLQVEPRKYILVKNFQHVTELSLEP